MRFAVIALLGFGLSQAQYDVTSEATTASTAAGYGSTATSATAATAATAATDATAATAATTGAGYGSTAGSAATTGSGYEATTGSGYEATTGSAATTGSGYEATTGSGYEATTGSGYAATTGSGYEATTGSNNGGSNHSGSHNGTKGQQFCHDHKGMNVTYKNKIVDLHPVASLNDFCTQTCNEEKCQGKKSQPGVLAPVQCLLDGASASKISPIQQCLIPCMLNLNALDNTCNADAIVGNLIQSCPAIDKEKGCIAACACCSTVGPLDACVNACLSSKGLQVQ